MPCNRLSQIVRGVYHAFNMGSSRHTEAGTLIELAEDSNLRLFRLALAYSSFLPLVKRTNRQLGGVRVSRGSSLAG